MSLFFKENSGFEVKVYDDGRTKQAFKDETDINKIIGKYAKTGVISHLNKFEASYGEFSDFDFLEAHLMINKGDDIFAALPSEVRREFDQDKSKFFAFVNDPKNADRLSEVLPGIAEKGDYFPDVSSKTPPGALLGGGEPGPAVEPVVPPVPVEPVEPVE